MKIYQVRCDRCGKPIAQGQNDRIMDFLADEYPGRDICPNCDLQIQLAATCAASDVCNNLPPGSTLKQIADMYGV